MKIIKIHNCEKCPYLLSLDGYECYKDEVMNINNYPTPNDNCPLKYNEIDNKILINNIELASNLAHNTLKDISKSKTEEELYSMDKDTQLYKEEVQDVFNDLYDYYLNIINEHNLLD